MDHGPLALGGSRVVFENDAFVAVDKPSGWLSVPGRIGQADERPVVGLVLEATRAVRIFPVHRLDAEVSGLTLYAKTQVAHRAANQWFEQRLVAKTYEAWCEGGPCAQGSMDQTWESLLERGKKRAFEAAHGKPAKTLARWLASRSFVQDDVLASPIELQHWRLQPHTGRPHQLRYELAKRAWPIAGDRLYGAKHSIARLDGIALRSLHLDFHACRDAQDFGLPSALTVGPLELA